MHISLSRYTPQYETEQLLRDAAKMRVKMTLTIPLGRDLTGIKHSEIERKIHYSAESILAVVDATTRLHTINCATDGYTIHNSVTAAINKVRKKLLKRQVAHVVDKLGNVYTVRNDRLHFFTNLLNKEANNV